MDRFTTKIIANNNDIYTVFYSTWCGYSTESLKLLKNHNKNYKGYQIDKISGGLTTLLTCLEKTKNITNYDSTHRTRPIIFNNGTFIGGFSDLEEHLDN